MSSFEGIADDDDDARWYFEAAQQNPDVIKKSHLDSDRKSEIKSGQIYIYDTEYLTRWTDGIKWKKAYFLRPDIKIYKAKTLKLYKKLFKDPNSKLRLVVYSEKLRTHYRDLIDPVMDDIFGQLFDM